MKAFPLVAALALAGCVQTADVQRLDVPNPATAPLTAYDPGAPNPLPAARSNAQMVRDFIELGFAMESGRPIAAFSRFDGPVRVSVRGSVPARAFQDLDRLLVRLRAEARIDIERVGEGGNISVEFLPRRQMQAVVPAAACFVVPNVASWDEFAANRRSPVIDWTRVVERRQVAVFVPSDTTAQEIRDCLHEEIGQALGPLNDLFRIPDTIFNDDNLQTTLTGFDMLLLRVWYAPELQTGMTREQVAARLPVLFNRLNPGGRGAAQADDSETPRAWSDAIEQALAASGGLRQRRAGAEAALRIARAQGWSDARLALSLMLSARLADRDAGEVALQSLILAAEIYRATPGGAVHAAHIDMHLAVQALAGAQTDAVLALVARAMPMAQRTENAAFEASLALIRAEALALAGQSSEAAAQRTAAMPAARYGFGGEAAARARQVEIARIGSVSARLAGL